MMRKLMEIKFTGYGVTFIVPIVDVLTLLEGDSAEGKTFLFNALQRYNENCKINSNLPKVNEGKIELINWTYTAFEQIANAIQGKKWYIICIDNADYLFDHFPELCQLIRRNPNNYYLIAGRDSYGLPLLPVSRLERVQDVGPHTIQFAYGGVL